MPGPAAHPETPSGCRPHRPDPAMSTPVNAVPLAGRSRQSPPPPAALAHRPRRPLRAPRRRSPARRAPRTRQSRPAGVAQQFGHRPDAGARQERAPGEKHFQREPQRPRARSQRWIERNAAPKRPGEPLDECRRTAGAPQRLRRRLVRRRGGRLAGRPPGRALRMQRQPGQPHLVGDAEDRARQITQQRPGVPPRIRQRHQSPPRPDQGGGIEWRGRARPDRSSGARTDTPRAAPESPDRGEIPPDGDRRMRPPTPSDASRSCTGAPASWSATAAVRPAIPAPTTITGRSGVGRGICVSPCSVTACHLPVTSRSLLEPRGAPRERPHPLGQLARLVVPVPLHRQRSAVRPGTALVPLRTFRSDATRHLGFATWFPPRPSPLKKSPTSRFETFERL